MKELLCNAKWITDKSLRWPKKESPPTLCFSRKLHLKGTVEKAEILCTAMGIYELQLDGKKLGDDFFAPGFTSYAHQLQVQRYDIIETIKDGSELIATVAGGWAVGAFTYNRKSRIAADFPSLLLEIHIQYADGSREIIPTDKCWQVTQDGPVRFACWYDGEIVDAQKSLFKAKWKPADIIKQRLHPKLLEQYGPPVRVWNRLKPVSVTQAPSGEWLYDFGQNFAGVIQFKINGRAGQELVFRHAEVLYQGELHTAPLRTAKQTLYYTCREGKQSYHPRFTYMGFRYVGLRGADPKDLELEALCLSSQLTETGSFRCSDERLNRLNENIRWGARSNFMDIPTDCPQRDERMGWTGDISVFARTACWNYDMSAFLGKWLKDVDAEMSPIMGIPMVVPRHGDIWPPFATACWGDCCTLVPWAQYMARGDTDFLARCYPTMKAFLKVVSFWAGLFSFGKQKYIWRYPFQFGDWCAPSGEGPQWMRRGPWIATAYYANSCAIAAQAAQILGYDADAKHFTETREKIINAFRCVFTDGQGNLHEEFQSAYVLPLHFGMVQGEEAKTMAKNLARLVEEAGNHLATGFPGTPYLLFALADNGYADKAYEVLLQEACPSWLYEVKMGGTTIWERWDSIEPDGTPKDNGMVSYNHYAAGAVGDFLYRRVLGVEAIEGGYRRFAVRPVPGGNLRWAEGGVQTPQGKIHVRWEVREETFCIQIEVPEETQCELRLPNGKIHTLIPGKHTYESEVSA